MKNITELKQENKIPIGPLRFYSDEKLSFCLKYSIHSIRCPKNNKMPIARITREECEACCNNE